MKINGRAIALEMYEEQRTRADRLRKKGIVPHLAVILVGDDPGSKSYIKQKQKWADVIGAKATVSHYPLETTTQTLQTLIHELNNDPSVHGIIVQRPLPEHIDKDLLARETSPEKDIDGFHPDSSFRIPVALATVKMFEYVHHHLGLSIPFNKWLIKQTIACIGKGDTAGKPIIDHLKKLSAQPVIVDSQTPNPDDITKQADSIITSVGKAEIINPQNIKPGVVLIGVGLSKNGEDALVGDYNELAIQTVASFYTPTPGGVGPVNVAYLLENLVTAAENQTKQ